MSFLQPMNIFYATIIFTTLGLIIAFLPKITVTVKARIRWLLIGFYLCVSVIMAFNLNTQYLIARQDSRNEFSSQQQNHVYDENKIKQSFMSSDLKSK